MSSELITTALVRRETHLVVMRRGRKDDGPIARYMISSPRTGLSEENGDYRMPEENDEIID